jgi:hypothetical protein
LHRQCLGMIGMGDTPRPIRCKDAAHRVIQLRFPYAEASVIRARLIVEIGAERVSALRRSDNGWAFVICRDCAPRGSLGDRPRHAQG